jgi:uncharacterized membrane protein
MSEDVATEPRRGRPRSQDTIARDEQVLAAFPEGDGTITRAQLAEATSQAEGKVYLSLHRLKRDGKIQRERVNGAHVWKRTPADAA